MTKKEKQEEKSLVIKETESLMDSELLLRASPQRLSDRDCLFVWTVLDIIEKELVAKRKLEFREHMLSLAETKGKKSETGSKSYEVGDGKITKQHRKGKTQFDGLKLMKKLHDRGFDVSRITTSIIDEEKIEALAVLGEITPDELKECSSIGDPTYALVVTKSKSVVALLKGKMES